MTIRLVSAAAGMLLAGSTAWAASQTAASGDAEHGEALYESRCMGCHSLDANRVGPRHRGVYGRVAGSLEDFAYSPAVAESSVVWSEETLDRWLANPQAFIPGQRMNFRVAQAEDRVDIIAFLKRESEGADTSAR